MVVARRPGSCLRVAWWLLGGVAGHLPMAARLEGGGRRGGCSVDGLVLEGGVVATWRRRGHLPAAA
jgi:hypothetical protein